MMFNVNRIGSFVGQGREGWMNLVRGFSKVRLIALQGLDRSSFNSVEVLQRELTTRLDAVKTSEAFRISNPSRLTVISFPENAAGGQVIKGAEGLPDRYGYAGWNALPLEYRPALASFFAAKMTEFSNLLHETTALVFPMTYDTGQVRDGRPVATNSAIVTGGVGCTLTVDKTIATAADAMGEYVVVPKSDGSAIECLGVKDVYGDGKGVVLGVKICIDASLNVPFIYNQELRTPDIAVIPGLGMMNPGVQDCVTLANDGADWLKRNGVKGITGAYMPMAEQFRDLKPVTSSHFVGNAVRCFLEFFSFPPSRVQRLSKVGGNTVYVQHGVLIVESPTVDIPATLEDHIVDSALPDILSGKRSVIDPTGEHYDEASEAPYESMIGDPPSEVETREHPEVLK